jgi:hypothetical protein
MLPLEFATNCVNTVPPYVKLNPIAVAAEFPSSVPAAIIAVPPETAVYVPVVDVNTYDEIWAIELKPNTTHNTNVHTNTIHLLEGINLLIFVLFIILFIFKI